MYDTHLPMGGTMEIVQTLPFGFYSEEFRCHYCDDGKYYLPIKDLCEAIGINVNEQCLRIIHDDAISDCLVQVRDPGLLEAEPDTMVECLRVGRLAYWMGSINIAQVKKSYKEKAILFKREFSDAVWEMFGHDHKNSSFIDWEDLLK